MPQDILRTYSPRVVSRVGQSSTRKMLCSCATHGLPTVRAFPNEEGGLDYFGILEYYYFLILKSFDYFFFSIVPPSLGGKKKKEKKCMQINRGVFRRRTLGGIYKLEGKLGFSAASKGFVLSSH